MISAKGEAPRYRTSFSNGAQEAFADTTPVRGGGAAGFRPHELLEAALASCANMTVRMYAHDHAIPLDAVTTQVRLERESAGAVFHTEIELHGDSLTPEQRERLIQAAQNCPVRRTLSAPVRFDSGTPDGATVQAGGQEPSPAPALQRDEPVAVGGVGGSGTRLIAGILLQLGFYLGSDLNESLDNLWFTLLFNRIEALDCSDEDFGALFSVFRKVMCGSSALAEAQAHLLRAAAECSPSPDYCVWLSQRAESSIRECAAGARRNPRWGWKEPNTHVVLPRLRSVAPHLRYIHVVRNPLDMAYSRNQNQLGAWGPRFLGTDSLTPTPRFSLKYWLAAHRRVLDTAQAMNGRFLLVYFDRLCADPMRELPSLLEFVGLEASPARLDAAASLVRTPDSVGRFKAFPREDFDPDDVALVAGMGFDTDWPLSSTAVPDQ